MCVCVCVCMYVCEQWRRKVFSFRGAGVASNEGREVALPRAAWKIYYATLCRVLRKRSRGTLDNVQHALVTSLKARGRDTIPV